VSYICLIPVTGHTYNPAVAGASKGCGGVQHVQFGVSVVPVVGSCV